jgi:dienelactone hydrolase
MSFCRRGIAALCVAGCVFLAPPARAQAPGGSDSLAIVASLFTYDAAMPLDARVIARADSAAFIREKVVFDGWRGSRVPAFVAVPRDGATRHPLIVLVDGIGGWKERWWIATSWNRGRVLVDSLLAAGFAVAMADAPASGERTYENDFVSAESFVRDMPRLRDMGIQTAIEQRRLIDYLVSRPDIDSTRIGMLGLSLGGMMTFTLSAVDSRIKAAVAGLTPMQNIPEVLSPYRFVASVRIPLLVLAGTKDGWYTRQQVERAFAGVAAADKKLVWYEVPHRVPEEYAGEATRWFRRVMR